MVTKNSRLSDLPCLLMSHWIQLKPHNCDYILPISLIFICCAKGFKISGPAFSATSFSLLDLIELRCGPGDLKTEMEKIRKEKHRQRKAEHKYIPGQNYQARALRALGLLLADGTPTVGGGNTF